MNTRPDPRPLSPYMLGPYYRFQITSLLSITTRITGVFLAVVGAPLALVWLAALAAGPEAFAAVQGFLGTVIGRLLVFVCLLSLCYHLLNGIRHLIWDTGRLFTMGEVRASGWAMVALTVALTAFTWWAAS